MAKKKETEFDKLARLIKNESEDIRKTMATKKDIADIRGNITDIRKTMATKEDIAGILLELADIKTRLKALEEAVEDHAGHSKEIDHAFERIAAIERHLGIRNKIPRS